MHIHHPLTQSASLNLPRSPHYSPVRLYPVSLHRRRFFRRGGKRKRVAIAIEGNRAGRGKGKSTPNAISHVVEKRYSRVRLPRKSPPGIFVAGHLRARRSPPLRSGENWERRGCICVCVRACTCTCVRCVYCTCGASGLRGILRRRCWRRKRGRSRGSIDRPPDRRGGSAGESVTGENASHIRYPRYVYRGTFIVRARAETCY